MILFIILLIIIFIIYLILIKRHVDFINEHSVTLKELDKVNSLFIFKNIENLDLECNYDNEDYYNDISTEDYLTYKLADNSYMKKVKKAINSTLDNRVIYREYKKCIPKESSLGQFDCETKKYFKFLLKKLEYKKYQDLLLKPIISFEIKVTLNLTTINNRFKTNKYCFFDIKYILKIIHNINDRNGHFYQESIWESISKVERGKVTNKLRFSIYERDNYKCKYCGSEENLEIDHIVPISKGGKSIPSNLQTLCHECNTKKGNR